MSLPPLALGEALLALPEPRAGTRRAAAVAPDEMLRRVSRAQSRARAHALAGEEIFRIVVALQDSIAQDLLPTALSSFTQALPASSDADRRTSARQDSPWTVATSANNGSTEEGVEGVEAAEAASAAEHAGADPDGDDADCVIALRAHAVSLVAAGEIGAAITVLCALLDWPEARDDALLGLAICAVRLDRHEAARTLALDYLKRGGRHPRAHCIVGVCHLRAGDKRAAQTHLAIAARAARADIAFRDELRAAQRLLIMLNFGR